MESYTTGMKVQGTGMKPKSALELIQQSADKLDRDWQQFMLTPEGTWAWLNDNIAAVPPSKQMDRLLDLLEKHYE